MVRYMNLRPLKNKLYVKQDDAATTSGLIVIPDSAQKRERHGTVLAVGPECKDVKEGDFIYWTNYGGEQVPNYDGVWLLRETDVMCIVDKEAK